MPCCANDAMTGGHGRGWRNPDRRIVKFVWAKGVISQQIHYDNGTGDGLIISPTNG